MSIAEVTSYILSLVCNLLMDNGIQGGHMDDIGTHVLCSTVVHLDPFQVSCLFFNLLTILIIDLSFFQPIHGTSGAATSPFTHSDAALFGDPSPHILFQS